MRARDLRQLGYQRELLQPSRFALDVDELDHILLELSQVAGLNDNPQNQSQQHDPC